MMEPILSVDPAGFEISFWLLVLLGVGLGVVVYLLLRRPGTRRRQFRSAHGVSGRVSLLLALLVTVPIVWYAYTDSWGHFYSVEVREQSVVLGYRYPARNVRIPRSEDLEISTGLVVRKGRTTYRLVVDNPGRGAITSQLISREEAEAAVSRLRAALAAGGK